MAPSRTLVGLAALAVLTIALPVRTDDPADAGLKAILEPDVKFVLDNLKGGSPTPSGKRSMGASRTALILIAKLADGKDDAKRDAALKAADAIGAKDFKGADAAAKEIASAKGEKGEKVDFTKLKGYDINTLMAVYRGNNAGLALESKLKAIAKDGSTKEAGPLLARVAAATELADHYTADFNPKKPKADWEKFQTTSKKAIADAQDAVKKGDAKGVKAAFTKLDGACTACHNVFK